MDQVLSDYNSAAISKEERALLAFVEKVNSSAADIRREDVEAAKKSGWSEEAIYDTITVCALFNFYNRWCDASGVHPLPDAAYRMAAKQTAHRGYAPKI